MTEPIDSHTTRRAFVKQTATASALAGVALPHVHSAVDDTIKVSLIGCGGRGTGAAQNALSIPSELSPTRLVAMADVNQAKLDSSYNAIKRRHDAKVDVPQERRYIGFDGYQHAMDQLRPGDVAIFTTPCAFRWVHFAYAIKKGLNVFMEKPVTPDGPSSRRMLALNMEAKKKNLKVGVGLMCRHCEARGELFDRIQNGEMGDLILMRAYRMHGPVASGFSTARPQSEKSELLWQIKRFHSFLWASGGSYSDYFIHNIDECCWMKNEFPVEAKSSGGRHYGKTSDGRDYVDQNFDSYSTEFTFKDGSKLIMNGRNMVGAHNEFASYAHGTKGFGVISTAGHAPSRARIHKGQHMNTPVAWRFARREPNPYQLEWNHLIEAIRENTPHNEVDRGVGASVTTSMGRMAAHTGQVITYDKMLNSEHTFCPDADKLTMDSPAPLIADSDGKYPVPMPGIKKRQEY